MNEQVYELVFLTSFNMFLIINLFNFRREFSYSDYFIVFPGVFFVLNLYLIEIRPLSLYIYIIFLFFIISAFLKNIKTILLQRNFKRQTITSTVLKIIIKIFITLPCLFILIIALTFSCLSLFNDLEKTKNSGYEIGFSRVKDYENNINLSVWYPITTVFGIKKQNPFLFYRFNPFFISEMNYLPKSENVYKNALISNNQKVYDTMLLILPFYSHDSMYRTLITELVKKGNVVYVYSPDKNILKDLPVLKEYDYLNINHSFLNKIVKYFVEPLHLLKKRKDKTTTSEEIQKVINLAKSTKTKEFLDPRMNLENLTLITLGNQANSANEIINNNKNIKKYINIGGNLQDINKINNLQLLLKQDEKKIEISDIKLSYVKIINMTNVGEISDFIFSRKYLRNFGFFEDDKLLLPRFSFIVNEIDEFVEGS